MSAALRLLGREDCGLCEEMEAALRAHPDFAGVALEICDVDADADWQRRYGLRVPVLLDAWNHTVCATHFDAQAFADWVREVRGRTAHAGL